MKKNLKKLVALLLCFAMVFALSACGKTEEPAPAPAPAPDNGGEAATDEPLMDPVEWDFCVINALTHPSSILCQQFADEVLEATDGLVKITVRAPGELAYSANDYLTAVGDNSIQISDVGSNCYGVLNVAAMSVLPYLASDLDEMDKVMDILEPYINDELAEFGAKYLFYYVWPAQSLWTGKKEISSLTDIKGLKIRTSNNELSELVKIWGGIPVSLTGAEVPSGLQTGVVDGVITSAYGLNGAAWYDSLNYGLIANCQIIPDYMCVNAEAFDALPQEYQDAIMELAKKYQKLMCESMFADEETCRDTLTNEHGMTIKYVDEAETKAMQDSIQDYYTEWCENRGGETAQVLEEVLAALGK